MNPASPFDLKFTSREVTAWGGLALLKRMLDGMAFKEAMQSWQLPPPGSNRGYQPQQLIEQMMSASGVGLHALPTPISLDWIAHWYACLAGAMLQATKPLCVCFSALTNPALPECKAAATAGSLTNYD